MIIFVYLFLFLGLFLQPLTRKYLRLSSQATVLHLKKFLAKKLSLEDHKDVSNVVLQFVLFYVSRAQFSLTTFNWEDGAYSFCLPCNNAAFEMCFKYISNAFSS